MGIAEADARELIARLLLFGCGLTDWERSRLWAWHRQPHNLSVAQCRTVLEIKRRRVRVVNKRGHTETAWDYYCGRPSTMGNPYQMRSEADRDAVCDKYDAWLDDMIRAGDPAVRKALGEINEILYRYGGVNLVCFCAPRRCHCDSIRRRL